MSVGEDYATAHRVKVGDTVTVAFAGGDTAKLKVAAVTSDETSLDQGAMYMNTSTAQQYVPPAAKMPPQNMLMFAKAKDGQEDTAYAALKDSLAKYPTYKVQNQADFKEDLKDQIGQLLNVVYGLLALAIIVAVLGVVNTLALSVVERTREIG